MTWVVDTCVLLDLMIGAYAMQKGGLITRNEADFRSLYPDLPIFSFLRTRRLSAVQLRLLTVRYSHFPYFRARVTFGDTRFSASGLCWNGTTQQPRFSCLTVKPPPYVTVARL